MASQQPCKQAFGRGVLLDVECPAVRWGCHGPTPTLCCFLSARRSNRWWQPGASLRHWQFQFRAGGSCV